MKMRKLASGREVEERDEEVTVISSKCPLKWVCIDLETRDVWVKDYSYRQPSAEEKKEAMRILMMKKKNILKPLYVTTVTVEIIHEDVLDLDNLQDVHEAITDGDCSGKISFGKPTVIIGEAAVKAIQAQGSDPEFFNINDKGEDLDQVDDEDD